MTSTATKNFNANAVAALIGAADSMGAPWSARTWFLESAIVKVETRLYMALNSGLTSTTPPRNTSGRSTDGGVTWAFVANTSGDQGLASNYYLCLGKSAVSPQNESEYLAVHNVFSAIRLTSRNMSAGVERRNWTSGEVVEQWPHENSYATVGNSVYRCISNNGGQPSTSAPSGTSLHYFELVDGYVWKFLGDIAVSQNQQFGSDSAFPLMGLYADDASTRWVVQTTARDGELSAFQIVGETGVFANPVVKIIGAGTGGAGRADITPAGNLRRVIATSPGSGYTPSTIAVITESGATGSGASATGTLAAGEIASIAVDTQGSGYSTATVVIVGDGTGASATATVTGGYVTDITVDNPGSGYTTATIYVVGGPAGAVASAIMAPTGGHGRDMSKELPSNYLLVNRRLTSLDGAYIPTGEFDQLSIVTGVVAKSGNGDLLVGPAHPSPGNLDAASMDLARPIFIATVDPVEHTGAEDEEIKISLKLV